MLPLVVGLDQRKEEAGTASQILHLLCSQRMDEDDHHADLLARLQGVRRLSVMFCPQLQSGRSPCSYRQQIGYQLHAVNWPVPLRGNVL